MDERALTFDEFMRLSESDRLERYDELSDNDKFKARLTQAPAIRHVMCNDCVHYHKDATCDAFPDGIPKGIISRGEHETPYPGDNGIRFTLGEK
ncbi:MAG: hypothetical protein ACLU8W_05750 [Clostridia bacterium]